MAGGYAVAEFFLDLRKDKRHSRHPPSVQNSPVVTSDKKACAASETRACVGPTRCVS